MVKIRFPRANISHSERQAIVLRQPSFGIMAVWIAVYTLLGIGSCFAESPPDITAKSAIVIDAATGKVLFAKNADERRYPASTTKMMTLIVALENSKPDEMVTTSVNAASTEGSTLWLTPSESLKMLDMLYGMMLVSGNDATVAIAEHIAGSVDKFAQLMTKKAHDIGAANTHFANSSGLPDPNHYSTATDLARIAAYGYKNPTFVQIVSTKHKKIPWAGKNRDRELSNENKMLWLYEGGNGVKTGYTDAAGRCLVSGANRNNLQLIAVVLDSDHMWEDSIALLNYGFSQFIPCTLFKKGDIVKTIRIENSNIDTIRLITKDSLVVPLLSGKDNDFRTAVEVDNKVDAPVTIGQKLGVMKTYYGNKEISSVDLLSADTAERKSVFGALWGELWRFFAFFLQRFA